MKIRYINEWYTGEPSADEYGEFITQAYQRIKDRYAPFELEHTYWYHGPLNQDGYIITLCWGRGAFTGYVVRYDYYESNNPYELFGPFGDPDDYNTEFPTTEQEWRHCDQKSFYLGKFRNMDAIMTKLFTDCDEEIHYWDD